MSLLFDMNYEWAYFFCHFLTYCKLYFVTPASRYVVPVSIIITFLILEANYINGAVQCLYILCDVTTFFIIFDPSLPCVTTFLYLMRHRFFLNFWSLNLNDGKHHKLDLKPYFNAPAFTRHILMKFWIYLNSK